MFQRFHEMREQREGGFTLIELLVVILIIAILAAIAIPVFLNQRKKGWIAQQESALKNAATAMESYATTTNGDYTGVDETDLQTEGYNDIADVDLVIVGADTDSYCLKADHTQATVVDRFYNSATGVPTATACTGAGG